MDNSQKKRKSAAVPTNARSNKKRKASAGQGSKTAKSKRTITADALAWQTVDIPEMFDDAEGFYGLEEVQGVEVVRTGDTVKFVTSVPVAEMSEEFEGFDDEPTTAEDTKPESEATSAKPKAKPAASKDDKTKDTVKEGKTKAGKKEKGEKKSQKKEEAPKPIKDELESNIFTSLANADDVDEDVDMSEWEPLGLSEQLLASLAKLKYSNPTSIQAAAIPKILAGHDVIGKAATGSGKTLAFGIPIVEAWLAQQDGKAEKKDEGSTEPKIPIGLILSPTRELAHQLTNHIKELCSGLPTAPWVCSVTGGLSLHKQQRQLEKADIIIGTPGRLWEVLCASRPLLHRFRKIRFLVVDEADRLLTEGHFKEAEEIIGALDRVEVEEDEATKLVSRQSLVFSATFNKGLQQKLAGKGKMDLMTEAQSMEYLLKKLNFREEKPKFVDVNPVSQMASGLKEGLIECGAMEKDLYLYSLLLLQQAQRTLVFTNSISAVRRLNPFLANLNLPVYALHSQMAQKARLRSVERFTEAKTGSTSILLATDVAARGLDIKGIDVVIHYNVPRTADAYVHRSGRTARAEKSGLSILICAPDEVVPTRRLVAKVHATAKPNSPFKKTDYFIRTIDIDRRIVGRLKERVTLAKKIADAALAKEKGHKDDDWMKNAAEELGVEYDSEDLEQASNWAGRGSGRKSKAKEARGLSKVEIGAMRAQLKALLSNRVNTGVSEKYIANGVTDMDELLSGGNADFLGKVGGFLDD